MMEHFKIFAPSRHECSVPGCRGKQSYRMARTAGAYHSLYLCRDCIALAYAGAFTGAQSEEDTNDAARAAAPRRRTRKGENDGERKDD